MAAYPAEPEALPRPQLHADKGYDYPRCRRYLQSHEPGAEAEVDFAELYVDLAGRRTKVFLFTLRLSYSGRAVHRVFASDSASYDVWARRGLARRSWTTRNK